MVITGDDLLKIKTHILARDLVYLPLQLQDKVIGVLGITNREISKRVEPFTLQLLSVLADVAAIAIHNARLYEATEHERDTLDAILRDTEDTIIVVDTQEKVLFCNPTACRMFGIEGAICQGRPLAEVLHHAEVVELFAKEGRGGRGRSSEISLDGGKRILNAQLTVIKGVGKVAVMQDITHLKELDRIKSDFVTTVSHDLRSPLTAILGYVELLSRSGPLNDQQRQFVERIIFSAQSITTLISDLLELGKIEAGFDQDREPTYLHLIARYAIEGLRHNWESKQHTVDARLPENLPPVLGIPARLRQLVTNLLENAIKYTPKAGISVFCSKPITAFWC